MSNTIFQRNNDMNHCELKAYAKVNLALDVLETLPNGYHEVRMVMQSVGVYDVVSLTRTTLGEIRIKVSDATLPAGPDNLVYKAADLLRKEFGIADGIDIDLQKNIPIAAGLAGGSSDAAAVLRGMNAMFALGLDEEALKARGVKIGADVPYCIMGGTALAEGIGEKLTKLPVCPSCYIVLAKPGISVSTKYVYDHLVLDENTPHPDIDGMLMSIHNQDLAGVSLRLGNVLETVTKTEYPMIGQIEDMMLSDGAINSIMSGSGPTVFGIFDSLSKAESCCSHLKTTELVKDCFVADLVEQEVILC